MCDPISISLGLGGVALASGIAGGVMSGIAANEAADASADAGRRNAEVAEGAASDALRRGEQDAGRVQMQGASMQGAQRAGLGAMGVDVSSGSAAQVQADTAAMTAMDMETARNNAQREAWGLRTQADHMRRDATAANRAGDLALIGGIVGGAAGGLSSAANIIAPVATTRFASNTTTGAIRPPGK